MTKPSIIDFTRPYIFSSYFELPYELEEIVAEFGYTSITEKLDLTRDESDPARLLSLRQRIEETIPHVSLTSEIARREMLIAPVLIDLIHYTGARLSIEYTLNVTEQLKGTLDYYLRNRGGQMLIVEAKKADLDKGFNQLAVELIALDKSVDSNRPTLIGAVSTGSIWQFGLLDREKKKIAQDLDFYVVPTNLEQLLHILVAILR